MNKPEYTGKIKSLNTIYNFEDIDFKCDSIEIGSPLIPEPSKALDSTVYLASSN